MVTLITKWTDPDLSGEINAGVRVENGGAGFATEGCVRKTRDIGMRTDEGDCGGEWDNAFGGFYFATWPDVPCHTDSVDSLGICVRHLRHRWCWWRISPIWWFEFSERWWWWCKGYTQTETQKHTLCTMMLNNAHSTIIHLFTLLINSSTVSFLFFSIFLFSNISNQIFTFILCMYCVVNKVADQSSFDM